MDRASSEETLRTDEDTLQESEARFRELADSAPVLLWRSGTDALCDFFNRPWLEFRGRTMEEEVGNGWFEDGVHPEDKQYCWETYASAFEAREEFEMEYRLRRHDGEYRWILDRGAPRQAPGGEFAGYIGSCIDVTKRKRTEVALRSNEERLSCILETNADGIVLVDRDGRITFANTAAEQIFHLRRSNITERTYDDPEWDITTVDGTPFANEELPFARVVRTGEPVYDVELAVLRPNGDRVILSVNGAPLRDAEGSVTGMVASFNDVTERRRAEEELRKRDAISEVVRFAAERFLRETTTWKEGVGEVLERFGQATGVSRVYVFENYTGEDGEVWATNTHEWVSPGVSPQIDNPLLRALPYKAANFGRAVEAFGRGETLHGHVRDLSEGERLQPEAEGTLSYVLVPIFVRDEWWGLIGFDECVAEREWSAPELDALRAASDNLGAAIGRERAEQDLKRERDFSSAVLDTAGSLVVVFDCEGRIVRFNRACEVLTGYSFEEVRGRHYWELFLLPEEVESVKAVMWKVAAGQFSNTNENYWVMRDGSQRLISWDNTALLDERKQPEYLIATGLDVTERRQAAQALREREEQYRSIFEETGDGLVITDMGSRLVEANPAFCRMHGYTREELLGRHARTWIHPDYHQLREQYKATIEAGDRFKTEALDVHKDGTPFPVEVLGTSFTLRGQPHILGVTRDVTERQRAEDELRESQRILATLMSNLPGMAYRCRNDEDWTMEFVSEGCFELVGHPSDDLVGNRRVSYGELIHPGDRDAVWEKVQAAIMEHRSFQINYRITSASGVVKWVREQGRGVFSLEGELLTIEGFITDQTDRVRAYRLLEERVASLTRIAATLTVERPMEDILNTLAASVVEASMGEACFVTLIDEASDAPSMAGSYGLPGGLGEALEASWRAGARLPLLRTFHEREPLFVRDARRLLLDDPLYAPAHPLLRESPLEAALIVPLVVGGHALGAISVYYLSEREPTEDERTFLGSVADQSAVAIENARLYEDVRRRVQERSALLEISKNVASTLRLGPLLDIILEQLKDVVDYVDSSVLVFEGNELVTVGYRGPAPREVALELRFSLEHSEPIWKEFESVDPMIIDDVLSDDPLAEKYRWMVGEELLRTHFTHARSWMGVPLVVDEQPVGLWAIIYDETGHYTERHAELARIIANQAAVAIVNARLYERAQAAAALEERQRLARELHDSVSQALYGIALGSKTARTLLDRDPERAAVPMDYVLSLAEAGLAEMRALIFELRPESLENEGLIAALEKQAAALRARHEIPIHATILCDEPDVPLEAKETLYRIAQEALHNTVKHARASRADLKLECEVAGVTLEIGDDGAGFDPGGAFPGHLGLKSMRERAERLGGALEVESAPGKGTRIFARIPSG